MWGECSIPKEEVDHFVEISKKLQVPGIEKEEQNPVNLNHSQCKWVMGSTQGDTPENANANGDKKS